MVAAVRSATGFARGAMDREVRNIPLPLNKEFEHRGACDWSTIEAEREKMENELAVQLSTAILSPTECH